MAVLDGFYVSSAAGGIDNPNLGDASMGFSLDWWPPYASLVANADITPVVSDLPVSANPTTRTGFGVNSYRGDFYNRIHINPQRIDLGNVVSEQVTAVRVFNAFFEPRQLNEITGVDEGINIQGPNVPPYSYPALTEDEWFIAVQPQGPATVNADIAWVFDVQTVAVPVTGTRVIGWPFAVAWSQPVVETLAWATDVLRSPTGTEQRRALRLAPRRGLSAVYKLQGRERQLLEHTLVGWGSRSFAVPIAPDVQWLATELNAGVSRVPCDTAGYDFEVGGLVMLYIDAFTWEVAQIDVIDATGLDTARPLQNAWRRGTKIYPVRSAHLVQQPELLRYHDQASEFEVSWTLLDVCDWPAEMPAAEYQGFPVLEQHPEESTNLTHSFARLLLELDNGSNAPRRMDTADRGFDLREHRWLLEGVEEKDQSRRLLYALRGRQVPLWVPTFASDLTINQIVTESATTLSVDNVGYARFVSGRPERSHIRIQLLDGTVWYREITGAAEQDDDTEQVQIDSSLGQQIAPNQVRMISYLVLCRLDDDGVEIEHETNTIARCGLVFRGVNDDV